MHTIHGHGRDIYSANAHHISRRYSAPVAQQLRYVDVVILFRNATELPRMDGIFGSADPYIVADIDQKRVSFR